MADVFNTIKNCALFEGFSELEILSILSELGYSIKSYPAGETVYHDDLDKPGSLGCVYLILAGEVSLALLRDTVLEHQLRILKAGNMFGVVLAFSKIPHIAYSYQTLSETVLMRIPVAFFGGASRRTGRLLHTRVLLNFLKITEDKAAFLYQKISCLKSLTVRERIVKYLSTLDEDMPQHPGYTRSQLANYLGISREALSRGLSGMQKEGLIEKEGGGIRIVEPSAFLPPQTPETPPKNRRFSICKLPDISTISTLALFEHLSPAEISRFLQLTHAKCIHLPEGEFLYRRGAAEGNLYILLQGTLSLLFEENTHPHLISQLEKGDITGDTAFFSSKHHFDISCKAYTDSMILVIQGEAFLSPFTGGLEGQEAILYNLFTLISRKISALRDKVHLLSNPAARQRILWYLYSLQQRYRTSVLTPPLNREHMAQYLGISRPALCKELRILEEQQILRVRRNTFEIIQAEQMEPLRF